MARSSGRGLHGIQSQRDAAGTPQHFITAVEDIDHRKRTEALLEARLRLAGLTAASHSLHDLLVATLDEACALTGSDIGFFHFLMPDQTTLSLQAWSTRTTREFCRRRGPGAALRYRRRRGMGGRGAAAADP